MDKVQWRFWQKTTSRDLLVWEHSFSIRDLNDPKWGMLLRLLLEVALPLISLLVQKKVHYMMMLRNCFNKKLRTGHIVSWVSPTTRKWIKEVQFKGNYLSETGCCGSGAVGVYHLKDITLHSDQCYFTIVNRVMTQGAVHAIQKLQVLLRNSTSNLTFQEAYDMTCRVLGVTVCSPMKHEAPRCLNYLASPHEASTLPVRRWRDGSLESDLLMIQLKELFNVNHFIISQANPQIAPFSRLKKIVRAYGGNFVAKDDACLLG